MVMGLRAPMVLTLGTAVTAGVMDAAGAVVRVVNRLQSDHFNTWLLGTSFSKCMSSFSKVIGIILLVILLGTGVFLLFQKEQLFSPSTKPFVYEEIAARYPVFDKEASATKENVIQVAQELEKTANTMKDAPQTVAYARYLVVRAYANAVVANPSDTQSLDKALEYGAGLIGDEDGYPNLRTYTIALIDTLLFPPLPPEVKSRVMSHAYFSRFGQETDGSVDEFRVNLLGYGNTLYRMTDIKYRLATLETQRLFSVRRVSPAMPAIWENVKGLLADAEASLARDRAGEMPFKSRSYLVEPLYYRAQFASLYLKVTGEKPLGEIDVLYTEALQMADAEMPKLRPVIENSWLEFKNNRRIR